MDHLNCRMKSHPLIQKSRLQIDAMYLMLLMMRIGSFLTMAVIDFLVFGHSPSIESLDITADQHLRTETVVLAFQRELHICL